MTINIHRICTILLYFTRLLSCHSNHFAVLIFLVRFSIVTLVSLGIQINKLNPLHYGSLRCSLLGSGSCMPLIDPAYAWYVRKPPTIRRIISQSSKPTFSLVESIWIRDCRVAPANSECIFRDFSAQASGNPIRLNPNKSIPQPTIVTRTVVNVTSEQLCRFLLLFLPLLPATIDLLMSARHHLLWHWTTTKPPTNNTNPLRYTTGGLWFSYRLGLTNGFSVRMRTMRAGPTIRDIERVDACVVDWSINMKSEKSF